MQFDFNFNSDTINSNTIPVLTMDMLKVVYYYKFEYISEEFLSIFEDEDILKFKQTSDFHISEIISLIKLLAICLDNKRPKLELISLKKYILNSFLQIIEPFDNNIDISNLNHFKQWLQNAPVLIFNNDIENFISS